MNLSKISEYSKEILYNNDFIKYLTQEFAPNLEFDFFQEREIELGILQEIDVSEYFSNKYSAERMRDIRRHLVMDKMLMKYKKKYYYYKKLFEENNNDNKFNEQRDER